MKITVLQMNIFAYSTMKNWPLFYDFSTSNDFLEMERFQMFMITAPEPLNFLRMTNEKTRGNFPTFAVPNFTLNQNALY